MKLPVTIWEKLQWAGPWRITAFSLATIGAGKMFWDSATAIYRDWAGKLTLETRKSRFDPARVMAARERREEKTE